MPWEPPVMMATFWLASVIGSLRVWSRRSSRGGLAGGSDLAGQCLERVNVDLREGGEGLDDIAQDLQRHARTDGQRGLLHPLASLGAERVAAGQPLAVAEQRQEAVGLDVGVGGRLGDLGELDSGAEPGLRGADGGGLRVRVDHVRYGFVVGLAGLA